MRWRAIRRRPQQIAASIDVDGTPLLDQIERATRQTFDVATPFGWATVEYQREYLNRLLLGVAPKLPSGRRELLVCPECADVSCGCISANIRRDSEFIVWSEIGYENDYDPHSLHIFSFGELVFLESDLSAQLCRFAPNGI